MKTLFLALTFLSVTALSVTSLGAQSVNSQDKQIEFGLYSAVDVDSGEVQSSLLMRPDGTVNFKVTTPDFTMPEPGCEGNYVVRGNILVADLECPILFFSEVHVEIDITTVTPESIRSEEGALVPVVIDLLGDEPTTFRLKKVN